MFTVEILEYRAFKGRYVYFMGQVFRKKQLKPPCSLTFQFIVEHFKHKKVIAF